MVQSVTSGGERGVGDGAMWLLPLVAALALACAPAASSTGAGAPPASTPPSDSTSPSDSTAAPAPAAAPGPPSAAAPLPLPEPGVEYRSLASRAGVDVVAYDLALDLTGMASGELRGVATLRVHATDRLAALPLDLVGLSVDGVEVNGAPAAFDYDRRVLAIRPAAGFPAGDTATVVVRYGGHPGEGLQLASDAQVGPTAFADNWPNRARWWFPSNDHPSDKATVRFEVRVPAGLEVVANGRLMASPDPAGAGAGADAAVWRWSEAVPIPTYTMVIGVARFHEAPLGEAACGEAPVAPGRCVAVTVWPLTGDSAYGVARFRRAPDIVDFLTRRIGDFPYEKLAHVESSTRFGGMENSSAIFYPRAPWERHRMGESVIAHETVHQWFGDNVTEARWSHVWLSEGFASYFDPLYYEARDGEQAFRERMEAARQEYLTSDVVDYPIVHDTTDLYWLLNANAYPKGAWVLHMLRGVLGDDAFFAGVRRYYDAHAGGTALTDDLQAALEATSGRDLDWFFQQWVYQPGYPQLVLRWRQEPADTADGGGAASGSGAERSVAAGQRVVVVTVRQVQKAAWPTFRIPTVLAITLQDGRTVRRPVELDRRSQELRVPVPAAATAVTVDPDGWVLKTIDVGRDGV